MNVLLVGYGTMGKLMEERLLMRGDHVTVYPTMPMGLKDEADILIDFSHPDNLINILEYGTSNLVPLVIATTNFTEVQVDAIEKAAKKIPILFTSNTSLGVAVMKSVLRQIKTALSDFDIEIIEKHHNKKVDAPSGTAKMLLGELLDGEAVVYGREGEGSRGNEIGVHAIRGGTIAGEHSVIFAGEDELFELKHTALSRKIFVTGAIKASEFIIKQECGLYAMSDVLK